MVVVLIVCRESVKGSAAADADAAAAAAAEMV